MSLSFLAALATGFRAGLRSLAAVFSLTRLLGLIVGLAIAGRVQHVATAPRPPAEALVIRVQRAVDGDTLLLENGHRVRLLGVNTPETHHPRKPAEPFGAEAERFTQQRTAGRDVRLIFDRERFDHFGRWLAFVEIDGALLNEDLVRRGYSAAQTAFPYNTEIRRRLQIAEQEARRDKRGIWSLPPAAPSARAPAFHP